MKKWFSLAVVVAVIIGTVVYVLSRVREDPERASELYEGVKDTAKATPEKATAFYHTAKDRLERVDARVEADAQAATEPVVEAAAS